MRIGEIGGNKVMMKKIKPKATVKYREGYDRSPGRHYIAYSCPTCGRSIGRYGKETACDECGTFYDWGNKEPEIIETYSVKWE